MNFDPRDLSILTQVVYKELASKNSKHGQEFWEMVEKETIELARTVFKVNKFYQEKINKK